MPPSEWRGQSMTCFWGSPTSMTREYPTTLSDSHDSTLRVRVSVSVVTAGDKVSIGLDFWIRKQVKTWRGRGLTKTILLPYGLYQALTATLFKCWANNLDFSQYSPILVATNHQIMHSDNTHMCMMMMWRQKKQNLCVMSECIICRPKY